jgi:hypothetical protein
LRANLARGLEATESAWPEVSVAFGRVHRAAAILRNKKGLDAAGVRRRFAGLMGAISRYREEAGGLDRAIGDFLKVTRSYRPGLFACYDTAGLPRTNNDLERLFGSYRHHERRCSGRKVASPGMVVRGSVRLISATTTRLRLIEGADLVPSDSRRGDRSAAGWSGGRRSERWATAFAATLQPTCYRSRML